jgi:hypothetical protein
MLAHESNLAELGPHGVPMSEAMDPANAFKFVSTVVTDYAAQTLGADQKAYYDQHDKDPKKPINRSGHLWSVRLKK